MTAIVAVCVALRNAAVAALVAIWGALGKAVVDVRVTAIVAACVALK